jgi:coenzyme F420-reducing hydrogenase gamma subunit
VHVIDGAGCSGCSNTIWLALQDLTKQLDYSDARVAMLFGAGGAEKAKEVEYPLICVGACSLHLGAQAVDVVKGCPPAKEEITAVVRARLEAMSRPRSRAR